MQTFLTAIIPLVEFFLDIDILLQIFYNVSRNKNFCLSLDAVQKNEREGRGYFYLILGGLSL